MSDSTRAVIVQPDGATEPFGNPEQALVPLNSLPPAKQAKVHELVAKLDMDNTESVITYGIEAQSKLTASADEMIQRVRNKDVGPVGDSLNNLMLEVRGLGIDSLRPGVKQGWFQREILRRIHPVARFIQRYETVQSQIDDMVTILDSHRTGLMRDVTMLDDLYDASVDYFQQLELYIVAAEEKLRQVDQVVLPQLQAKAEETGDMLDAQKLRDTAARRSDLDRRIHDLKLTRVVTLQSMPQIRLIQDVDKSLVTKIQSSILTTIPVWKSQIAMAITLWNQRQAVQAQRAITDTTNEMLARNSEMLKTGSAEARREIERGIFDIATIKKINADLISTIQESIQIAQEGRTKRAQAETEMKQLEGELRQALLNAKTEQQRLLTR